MVALFYSKKISKLILVRQWHSLLLVISLLWARIPSCLPFQEVCIGTLRNLLGKSVIIGVITPIDVNITMISKWFCIK